MHPRNLLVIITATITYSLSGMGNFGSIGDTFTNLGKGIVESVGHCFGEQYNIKVINDAAIPIHLEVKQIRQFMGAESEFFADITKGFGISSLQSINQVIKPYQSFATTPNFNLCFGKVFIDPMSTKSGESDAIGSTIGGAISSTTDWMKEHPGEAIPIAVAFPGAVAIGVSAAATLAASTIAIAGVSYFWERGCEGRFFCKAIAGSEEKSEQDTNYYHTFTYNGSIGAEFMGPGMAGGPFGSTSEFDGVFYNKLNSPVQLTFKKNGTTYTVMLDEQSFNTLSSDKNVTDSIRSNTEQRAFVFSGPVSGTIPIPAQGVGDKIEDTDAVPTKDSKEKSTKIVPKTTTYEITKAGVGIQGYNLGNYDQFGIIVDASAPIFQDELLMKTLSADEATKAIVKAQITRDGEPDVYPWRSLNPIPCSLLYKSSTRALADYAKENPDTKDQKPNFIDDFEQVWVAYDSGDFPDTPIMKQLKPDTPITINIIRPMIKKGLAHLYVFSIATSSESDAQIFLQDALKNNNLIASILSVDQVNDVLTAKDVERNTQKGSYTAANGVTGWLLYVDNFIPYGSGDATARFYEITPPVFDTASFAQSLMSLFNQNITFVDATTKVEAGKVGITPQEMLTWLKTSNKNRTLFKGVMIGLNNARSFAQKLEQAIPEFTAKVKANAADGVLIEKTTTFSDYGYQELYKAIFMPRGFMQPPLMRFVGSNISDSVQEGETWPSNWPKQGT